MSKRVGMIFEAPKVGMTFAAMKVGMIFRLDVMAPEIKEPGYGEDNPYGDKNETYGFVGLERK